MQSTARQKSFNLAFNIAKLVEEEMRHQNLSYSDLNNAAQGSCTFKQHGYIDCVKDGGSSMPLYKIFEVAEALGFSGQQFLQKALNFE